MRALLALLALLFMAGAAQAQNCTVPNTFINGTIIDAGQMNANMSALTNCVNNITTVNIKQFGGDPSGVGANNTALTSIFALSSPTAVVFPAGTYRVACPASSFVATSSLTLLGVGKGQTIIRLDSGCALTGDVMSWTNKSNVHIDGVTLDLNTPVTTAQYAGMAFYVNGSNSLQGPYLNNMEVINSGSSSGGSFDMRLSVLASTASWNSPIIVNSRFTKTVQDSTTQNQCIAFSGSGSGDSAALGNIHRAFVYGNECANTGMQVDGDNGIWMGNNIHDWAFGNGIFAIYNSSSPVLPTSDHDNIFANNDVHDSPTGYDANSSAASCIETSSYRSLWIGNQLHGCGGEGFRNYASRTTIQGGAIYDNAKTTTFVGNYIRAGINAVQSGIGEPYKSANLAINNVAIYDSGAATQLYAYGDANGIDGPVSIIGPISGVTAATNQNSVQGTLVGDPWQTLTTTLGCGTGTITSATGTLRERRKPFSIDFTFVALITTNGTCAQFLTSSLPVAADPASNSFDYMSTGQNETTATTLWGSILHSSTTTLNVKRYDGIYPGADSTVLVVTGSYPTTP